MNAYERRRDLARLKRESKKATAEFKAKFREHQLLRAYETAYKYVFGYEPQITRSLSGGWFTVRGELTLSMRLRDFPMATSALYAARHEREMNNASEPNGEVLA